LGEPSGPLIRNGQVVQNYSALHTVARVVMTGTHRGDLFGLAPTGRGVRVGQINIEEIGPDGLIHNHWRVTDELSLMRQLGQIA
jgi:predicted ester cyclase